MAQQLYTPFLERSAQNITGAMERRDTRRREEQEKKLFGQAYMGDPQARERLGQTNPQALMQIDQMTQQRKQNELALRAAQQKQQIQVKEIITGALTEAAKFDTMEEAQTFLDSEIEANRGIIDPSKFQPLTPESFEQIKTRFGEKPDLPLAKMLEAREATAEGSEERRLWDQQIVKQVTTSKGMKLSVDKEGNITFSQGDVSGTADLTKPVTTQVQKDVIKLEDLGVRLASLNDPASPNYFDPDQLTHQGRILTKAAEVADRFGISTEDAKKRLTQHTRWSNTVDQIFNNYRQEITGAAASVAELDRLKKALLNTDQSPTQYRASLAAFQDEINRGVRVKKMLLSQGIDIGTKEGAETLDEAIARERDVPKIAGKNPAVASQAEFDALPSGALYTENGQQFRKP